MTGLKLNWNIFDWNKAKKDQQSLEISKEIIATEKETFELNTTLQANEWTAEIGKLKQIISTDESIVELREKILKSADAQMRNGVITTAEYLNEVTQLFESKIAQKTHEIQLQLAKSTHQIIIGN
jgi:outer membrane protein TolC